MIDCIAFLSIAFGLFGIFIEKYISLHREIFLLWIEEIAYIGFDVLDTQGDKLKKNNTCCQPEAIRISSKVDAYTRSLCSIVKIIKIIVYIILFITLITILFSVINLKNIYEYKELVLEVQDLYFLSGLLLLTSIAMILIINSVDINIIIPGKHNDAEERLFDIWCKYFRQSLKCEPYGRYLKPFKMFEILAERINEYNIEINEYNIKDTDIGTIMKSVIENRKRRRHKMYEENGNLCEKMINNKCLKKKIKKGRKK